MHYTGLRPTPTAPRSRMGRPRKPKTAVEAVLNDLESDMRPVRTRLSGKHRKWIELHVAYGFKEPERAAREAGFVEPGMGYRLMQRFAHLIEAERRRQFMGTQMEVDEALRLIATLGREADDEKTRLAALRTVMEVNGHLRAQPLAPADRAALVNQVAQITQRIASALDRAESRERASHVLGADPLDRAESRDRASLISQTASSHDIVSSVLPAASRAAHAASARTTSRDDVVLPEIEAELVLREPEVVRAHAVLVPPSVKTR